MGRFVVKDFYFKKAKDEGYRARSAYKLLDIQKKYRLIKKGDSVLDLGCAPGSFLQVISDIIGKEGKVIGIDLLPVMPVGKNNVSVIKADIRHIDIKEICKDYQVGNGFDVITCDIAPNLSGIRETDESNIDELTDHIFRVVAGGLKRGGHFVLKTFFSRTLKARAKELKNHFQNVAHFKPGASRSVSSEVYLVCQKKTD